MKTAVVVVAIVVVGAGGAGGGVEVAGAVEVVSAGFSFGSQQRSRCFEEQQ